MAAGATQQPLSALEAAMSADEQLRDGISSLIDKERKLAQLELLLQLEEEKLGRALPPPGPPGADVIGSDAFHAAAFGPLQPPAPTIAASMTSHTLAILGLHVPTAARLVATDLEADGARAGVTAAASSALLRPAVGAPPELSPNEVELLRGAEGA